MQQTILNFMKKVKMPCLFYFNRRFTPSWSISLVTGIVLTLLLRLGFWQLDRAEEKKWMVAAQAYQAKQRPLHWNTTSIAPKQYQRLTVEGHYLSTHLLLDNQYDRHQWGYHVLSPFLLNDHRIVMVDRGWVAGPITRQIVPKVITPIETIYLSGEAYYPSRKTWVLGAAYEKKDETIILEQINIQLISQLLHKSVSPFIIRLGKNEAHGYLREWTIIAMPPQRHYAYALQWFAMAVVVFILFIALNLKKSDEKKQIE